MSIFNLPGTTFKTSDGVVSTTPPPPTGDTILIIGQALDGPVNTPIPLQSIKTDVEQLFGPTVYTSDYISPDGDATKKGQFSGNTLMSAMHEAIQGGAGSIILVRVGGTVATDGTNTLLATTGISVSAQFPGAIYNGATLAGVATVTGGITFTATQPSLKGGNFTLNFGPTVTFDNAAAAFNNDPRNGTFKLACPVAVASNTAASNAFALVTATLAGGTNGTLKDDFAGLAGKAALYAAITNATTGTFAYIDGWQADFLCTAGIYADDDVSNGVTPTQSYAIDAAQFAYNQSQTSYPMIAMLGVQPSRDNTQPAIRTRVSNLTSTSTAYANSTTKQLSLGQFFTSGINYSDPNTGQTVDIGRHLCIHAGPDVIYTDTKRGAYLENPVMYYTGLVSALPPQIGALNQIVRNVSPYYLYTQNQLRLLDEGIGYNPTTSNTGGGAYVTFKQANQIPGVTTIRVTDDVTVASRDSFYSNLQAIRIVDHTESVVQQTAMLFLGMPNNAATITAMTSQVRTALDTMASNGAYNGEYGDGYTFTITPVTGGRLGSIRINLSIKPAFEVKFIDIEATVSQ